MIPKIITLKKQNKKKYGIRKYRATGWMNWQWNT